MALPLLPIGLALAGAGTLGSAWSQDRASRRAAEAQRRIAQQAQGMMQHNPDRAERMLLELIAGRSPGESFNTGQDWLMQMLRSDPMASMQSGLEGTLQDLLGGESFDTTELFGALGEQDRRRTDEGVAGLRAGASGLGQRFGTAMARNEANFRGEANENAASRNAQIAMQSHEAAQGRRMGAAQLTQQMQDALLGRLMQSIGLAQSGRAGQIGELAQLFNMGQGRRGMNANLLGIASGQPGVAGASAIPGAFGDIGQLLAMLPLLQQLGGGNN